MVLKGAWAGCNAGYILCALKEAATYSRIFQGSWADLGAGLVDRGQLFFLCNFVLFLMNSLKQNIDSSYITGKFPDRLFLNFRDPPLRIVLKEPFASNHR